MSPKWLAQHPMILGKCMREVRLQCRRAHVRVRRASETAEDRAQRLRLQQDHCGARCDAQQIAQRSMQQLHREGDTYSWSGSTELQGEGEHGAADKCSPCLNSPLFAQKCCSFMLLYNHYLYGLTTFTRVKHLHEELHLLKLQLQHSAETSTLQNYTFLPTVCRLKLVHSIMSFAH